MAFLTDRKRAVGMGAAKSGTEHFWAMKKSSVALLILIPFFVFTFGGILGSSFEEVQAYYARPFPAIIAAVNYTGGSPVMILRCVCRPKAIRFQKAK